jgi:hypothetical protein
MTSFPYVGRTVHYVSRGSADGRFQPECKAAIVTDVSRSVRAGQTRQVHLAVLNPSGLFYDHDTPYADPLHDADDLRGGTWHLLEDCVVDLMPDDD